MIYPCIRFEILAELMQLLNQRVLLLLRIVLLKVFVLLERKLDVDELVDILIVHKLGLQELNP